MIEGSAHVPERALEHAKIHEHPSRVERFPRSMRKDPVIVAVQTFALAVKIGQIMGGREFGLYSCFVHG